MQEPAQYDFTYDVTEPGYAVEFGHAEVREGENAKGAYYVLLPDGRRQRVDYTADLAGYKPTISYEDTGAAGRAGGYGGAGDYQSGGYSGGVGGYQAGGASGYQAVGNGGHFAGRSGEHPSGNGGYPSSARTNDYSTSSQSGPY